MIELQFKKDGVWIHAKSKTGFSGLLNLNNIINNMNATIAQRAFTDSIKELIEDVPIEETE